MHPYRRLADELRRRIQTGTLKPGDKLPSRRELCVEFEVSDIVVGAAMRILHDEHLVVTVSGIGVYVAEPLGGGDDVA
jgi:DNA-binding GntR family transcriptional regulator